MKEITILIWIAIAIIAIISIIVVKSHYNDKDDKEDSDIDILNDKNIHEDSSFMKNNDKIETPNLSPDNTQHILKFKKGTQSPPKNDDYVAPEVNEKPMQNFEYESKNKVLINYDNKVKKFQEPIKQSQIDIMTQINKNREETELKDLFTIDELIKESKRKDSQREKESRKIKRDDKEDKELEDIKESIKNKKEEALIEDILKNDDENSINDLLNDVEETKSKPTEVQTVLTQEDVDAAILKAANEKEKEIESKPDGITDTLLREKKISEPALKSPNKIDDVSLPIDDSNLKDETEAESEEEGMDLDYRKDIDKFTKKIKGSKLYQEFKEKITPEAEEFPEDLPENDIYIRNVSEYDDYEPIINETHLEYENKYGFDELSEEDRIRQENTKKVFNSAKSTKTTKSSKSSKSSSIQIKLNNNDVTLKKGDEIIFNYDGETYSSQVYDIKGDNISVKYRRKFIKIKPNNVKKIY